MTFWKGKRRKRWVSALPKWYNGAAEHGNCYPGFWKLC